MYTLINFMVYFYIDHIKYSPLFSTLHFKLILAIFEKMNQKSLLYSQNS